MPMSECWQFSEFGEGKQSSLYTNINILKQAKLEPLHKKKAKRIKRH